MNGKFFFVWLILLLGFFPVLQAQDDYEESDWERWKKDARPFLEGTYGIGSPEQVRFEGDFSQIGLVEGKLGYSKIKQYKNYVYSLDESFLYGGSLSTDLNFFDDDTLGKVNTETIRFGFANRLGYGYNIGAFNILPYNERSLVWTKVKTTRPDNLVQTDIDILNRYENSFRFGELTEGGVKLNMFRFLSLSGAYELQVVYPRHLFWKWLGSILIRDAGTAAITVFSEDILDRTAFLGPIIYFVLKNGLTYAFYNAMRYNMNWPFETEAPLTFVNYKLGVTLTF
jgi:hypothetical protein